MVMIQIERERIERIKENAERKIFVTFKREALHVHKQLDVPENHNVSFLTYPHRHVFHFRVWIDVRESDIEPIKFKQWIKSLYQPSGSVQSDSVSFLNLNNKSCEELADELYLQIAGKYAGRAVWIEVAEDGENGCLIKYELSRPNLSITY